MTNKEKAKAYWRENLKYVVILLTIWFLASYGAGMIFKDALNTIKIGGFKLGFWFAQQGSIYAFLGIIFYYAWKMRQIDREFGVDE